MPLGIEHNLTCDNCRKLVVGLRIACLQCVIPSYTNEVDLCRNCHDTFPVTVKPDYTFTHKNEHDVLLTDIVIPQPDLREVYEAATERVNKVKADFYQRLAIPQLYKQFKEHGPFGIHCKTCDDPLVMPCWACFTCESMLCQKCALNDEDRPEPGHRYVRLSEGNIEAFKPKKDESPAKKKPLTAIELLQGSLAALAHANVNFEV